MNFLLLAKARVIYLPVLYVIILCVYIFQWKGIYMLIRPAHMYTHFFDTNFIT